MNGKAYARQIYESIQPNLITPKKLMEDPIFGQSAKKMFSVSNIEREFESPSSFEEALEKMKELSVKYPLIRPDSPRFSPKVEHLKVEK